MKTYIFNPEYVINDNEKMDVVFSSDMERVYILKEVESKIVKTFFQAKNIEEAVVEIGAFFSSESFVREECIEFIDKLIEEGILVGAKD